MSSYAETVIKMFGTDTSGKWVSVENVEKIIHKVLQDSAQALSVTEVPKITPSLPHEHISRS